MLLQMGPLLHLGTVITLVPPTPVRGLIQLETTYKTVTKGLDTYLITGQK